MPRPSPSAPANHYETLGVARTATAEQIRRAYRAKARKLHPDVNPAPDAQARFAALQNAYEVLSDPKKRDAYDRSLDGDLGRSADAAAVTRPHYSWRNVAADASPGADAGPDRTDLDDMYDAFFGRRGE